MKTKEIAECLKTKYGLITGEFTLSKLQERIRDKSPDNVLISGRTCNKGYRRMMYISIQKLIN